MDRKDNTKTYLKEISWEDLDWFYVAQDGREWQDVVNKVKFRLP